MHLQESGEMYLETILVLSKTSSFVRSIDISEKMGYSKPSISRAIGLLKNGGYVTVEENGAIVLTGEGRKIAEQIYERHRILTRALILLGIDPAIAEEDACRVEHVISEESFQQIKQHLEQSKE